MQVEYLSSKQTCIVPPFFIGRCTLHRRPSRCSRQAPELAEAVSLRSPHLGLLDVIGPRSALAAPPGQPLPHRYNQRRKQQDRWRITYVISEIRISPRHSQCERNQECCPQEDEQRSHGGSFVQPDALSAAMRVGLFSRTRAWKATPGLAGCPIDGERDPIDNDGPAVGRILGDRLCAGQRPEIHSASARPSEIAGPM
jgi:hypothetical protein